MQFKSLAVLLLSGLAAATHVHNQYGHDGYIQDNQGTEVLLKNGKSVDVGGGWGFFWVQANICHQNAIAYTWPKDYGDVYIRNDGRLYDAGGSQISNGARICST
ncbi:hypothetical protein BJX64DRAFT_265617 [Aspergillus heterothallicus]